MKFNYNQTSATVGHEVVWLKARGWSVVPQFFNSTVRLIFPSFRVGVMHQALRDGENMHVLLCRAVERRARVGHYFVTYSSTSMIIIKLHKFV